MSDVSDDVRTHWEGCYESHHECAVELVRRLRAEIDVIRGQEIPALHAANMDLHRDNARLDAELAAIPVCSEHEAGLGDLPVACVVCEIAELRFQLAEYRGEAAALRGEGERVEGWATKDNWPAELGEIWTFFVAAPRNGEESAVPATLLLARTPHESPSPGDET